MVLFSFCLLPSLPLLELEAVVTVIVEAVVVVESVLSPEQTIVERHYSLIHSEGQKGTYQLQYRDTTV